MKTWNDYKKYIKSTNSESKADVEDIESISMIVGSLIEQRNNLGLSQRDLAEMCGLPQSSVARIESYKTIPNLNTLIKICRSLGLTLSITNKI